MQLTGSSVFYKKEISAVGAFLMQAPKGRGGIVRLEF
jgi:hypothetical protein